MLTQKYLKECLKYNPETGVFTWLKRPQSHFKRINSMKYFNGRYAGKEAGNKKDFGKTCKIMRCTIFIDGKQYYRSRLAWLYVYGENPDKIDHINGDSLDDRITNLRKVSVAENNKNTRLSKSNKSGVVGVSFNKRRDAWVAAINQNNKTIQLGSFKGIFEAVCARKSAEKKLGYHANHGRIVAD